MPCFSLKVTEVSEVNSQLSARSPTMFMSPSIFTRPLYIWRMTFRELPSHPAWGSRVTASDAVAMTRSVLFTSTAAALLAVLPEEEEEPPQAVALTISAKASRTLKIRFILFLLYCCVLSLAGRGG